MAKKLFVGSLPYQTTDSQLEELFTTVGNVASATVITDRFSGQGKGFGFVEMATEEEAQEAVKRLNGTEFQGRNLIVNEARPQEDRSRGGFGNRGGGGGGSHPGGGFQRTKRW